MCLSKNINDNKIARLACSYDRWTGPQPVPTPQISWYKDGELVYSELTGRYLNPNDSAFIAANPLLAYGVFDQVPFVALSSGNIFLLGSVTNITSPSLLPPGTTLKQAQDQLLTLLVGNWTCKLNNTLGSSSITYMIRECGKLNQVITVFC